MNKIRNKLLVMSGKGGVGKTTIAVNLAYALSQKGFKVGLLDVDIHGPNVPKMLNLEDKKLQTKDNKIIPIEVNGNLKVMSMAFLLNKKDAAIWRGPMKHNVIRQFIEDVEWGELDYLIIDFPPGTGDECISISQLLKDITGSIIVSTPQQVSLIDVEKSIDFSRNVKIPIIGIIENMSGNIFGGGTVSGFAASQGVDYLGSLNMDKGITESGDKGEPFVKKDSK
ncbi:MAG: Mrp/NBP35 family ATP-binding protein, partial [Nanoarchaeota archaeon]|nr:Mrp/NBP35 family ATP-binding protein [Nanoarchaeota archaeon]